MTALSAADDQNMRTRVPTPLSWGVLTEPHLLSSFPTAGVNKFDLIFVTSLLHLLYVYDQLYCVRRCASPTKQDRGPPISEKIGGAFTPVKFIIAVVVAVTVTVLTDSANTYTTPIANFHE
ncbi:hypothetical protein EGR_09107 [Echinococcus granulosus]|uniref:Uncharacterized protein n=1 Tax=Echinococcus granulosus TaxID=6210 RepID=W6UCM2_ECHGR|nr:hypothetical protein EGR_09107 [Echinococcus granulosus]EUB56027.1 hypothetical protein EGR_09107 [Echinococcus granulosus]